ncbi:hypothetical protein Ddye_030768 [Dipteronia dyeriana]|uniref:PTBP1-like RNA recognition motif 2 domain-containing protein n=1 Tax=Dipteronia dyeriana TaxID=168575 RepID=A0AAD9THP7_9ROSI|nr:hypothetical protein Ddye_030768 [Dipteronia dyeriana]
MSEYPDYYYGFDYFDHESKYIHFFRYGDFDPCPIDESNGVLQVTARHIVYPITREVLHQVFSPYGYVERIVGCQKSKSCFQALIQFQFHHSAFLAKSFLQGRNIYDGCCQLDIQYWQDEHYAPQRKQQQELIAACQNILPKYFGQVNNLVEERNKGKVHYASETVDPSSPISKLYEPSGDVCEVQTVNHLSSLVVHTHEKLNMVVTKPIQLDETLYKGFIDVPMGSMITPFPITMMGGPWVDKTIASTRNKWWQRSEKLTKAMIMMKLYKAAARSRKKRPKLQQWRSRRSLQTGFVGSQSGFAGLQSGLREGSA